MNEIIKIHGDDWKLSDVQEDIDWCVSQQWTLQKYAKTGDHAHCSVCWWTIGVSEDPDMGEAYWTQSNHWLCKECHSKFIKKEA